MASEPTQQQGPLDGFLRDTNMVLLILISVCCSIVGLILGIIGLATGKDPQAKKNAQLMTIISGALIVVGCIADIIYFIVISAATKR